MGMGTIRLQREKSFSDVMRKYKVFVDGKMINTISSKELIEFELTPGEHDIHLKIDWCYSNVITVNVKENEDIQLICGNSCEGSMKQKALLYITIWYKNYLYIGTK